MHGFQFSVGVIDATERSHRYQLAFSAMQFV
jgi:hypothetical protein